MYPEFDVNFVGWGKFDLNFVTEPSSMVVSCSYDLSDKIVEKFEKFIKVKEFCECFIFINIDERGNPPYTTNGQISVLSNSHGNERHDFPPLIDAPLALELASYYYY